MKISLNDLRFNNSFEEYLNGYRIVYFYDDHYRVENIVKL